MIQCEMSSEKATFRSREPIRDVYALRMPEVIFPAVSQTAPSAIYFFFLERQRAHGK